MNSKQVSRSGKLMDGVLCAAGGSHHQFRHPEKPGLVTVKHPDSDIPMGTMRNIERQAGWRK